MLGLGLDRKDVTDVIVSPFFERHSMIVTSMIYEKKSNGR